jgi:hypothetical protein
VLLYAKTTAYSTTLDWSDGSYDGGLDVIDYSISYIIVSDGARRLQEIEYILLAEGITDKNYHVTGLTPGTNYLFVIRSRNKVGYGDYSDPVPVFTA